MSDPSAVERTDLLVRLVLESVDQRLRDVRDEVARIAVESEQHQREVANLATELARWLTAKARAETAISDRVDELAAAVESLTAHAPR